MVVMPNQFTNAMTSTQDGPHESYPVFVQSLLPQFRNAPMVPLLRDVSGARRGRQRSWPEETHVDEKRTIRTYGNQDFSVSIADYPILHDPSVTRKGTGLQEEQHNAG
jgi:hypothetical protein